MLLLYSDMMANNYLSTEFLWFIFQIWLGLAIRLLITNRSIIFWSLWYPRPVIVQPLNLNQAHVVCCLYRDGSPHSHTEHNTRVVVIGTIVIEPNDEIRKDLGRNCKCNNACSLHYPHRDCPDTKFILIEHLSFIS